MSHCNISMRDPTTWELLRQIDMGKAERNHIEARLKEAESNLRSIFDRIKANEEVYLVYPDGEVVYIERRTDSADG